MEYVEVEEQEEDEEEPPKEELMVYNLFIYCNFRKLLKVT